MWQYRSKILTPLSSTTSKQAKWNWNKVCQKIFDTIRILGESLLFYPNLNEPFEINIDTNKLQRGSVISQKVKSIPIYCRKLNPAQVNYTTTERGLLSIMEALTEFRNILLG